MSHEDDIGTLAPSMAAAQQQFMVLVGALRPELHRYCGRLTGSVFDGEDIVQETLAKAHYALGQMHEPPALKPWLFRIAHNTAMDFLRRHERKHVELVPEPPERAELEETGVDPALVEAALTTFVELPPSQRSALILKDVLGHSLQEIAATLGISVVAVKAALSRARASLSAKASAAPVGPTRAHSDQERADLQRYVDLFNLRDWDGLRGLLREQAQLDLVSRGRRSVAEAGYYDRYAEVTQHEALRAEVGWVDGELVVAMFDPAAGVTPRYFLRLEWSQGRVVLIRDFRYVPYIANDARFSAWLG